MSLAVAGVGQVSEYLVHDIRTTAIEPECHPMSTLRRRPVRLERPDGLDGVPQQSYSAGKFELDMWRLLRPGRDVEADATVERQ